MVPIISIMRRWRGKMVKKYGLTIRSRNGEIDVIIPDGKYNVNAEIIIEKGKIKYIDNGKWAPLIQDVSQGCGKNFIEPFDYICGKKEINGTPLCPACSKNVQDTNDRNDREESK